MKVVSHFHRAPTPFDLPEDEDDDFDLSESDLFQSTISSERLSCEPFAMDTSQDDSFTVYRRLSGVDISLGSQYDQMVDEGSLLGHVIVTCASHPCEPDFSRTVSGARMPRRISEIQDSHDYHTPIYQPMDLDSEGDVDSPTRTTRICATQCSSSPTLISPQQVPGTSCGLQLQRESCRCSEDRSLSCIDENELDRLYEDCLANFVECMNRCERSRIIIMKQRQSMTALYGHLDEDNHILCNRSMSCVEYMISRNQVRDFLFEELERFDDPDFITSHHS